MKKTLMLFILSAVLTFALSAAGNVINTSSSSVDTWYSTSVNYELFVRSFRDTNGDKFGDFKGVMEKLDYLQSLGITAVWFLPVTDSFERKDGYDVIDFMNTSPDYGTLDDYRTLVKEMHKRNIKVIFDLVLNHTSDKHPFFIDAVSNKKSKYRDWYVFKDKNPGRYRKGSWYPDNKDNPTSWYFSQFVKEKPDLNYHNPQVLEYMKQVVKFWIDQGVDGFRLDAISVLVENGPEAVEGEEDTFNVLRELRKYVDDNFKDKQIFIVGESATRAELYVGNGNDICHSVFNFKMNRNLYRYINNSTPYTQDGIDLIEDEVLKNNKLMKEGAFWSTVLSNHDDYVGPRPFRQLEENIDKCRLAGTLYLTLPGIPFIYYGEEIGMDTMTKVKSDRFLRTLMQWDDSNQYAGFTDKTEDKAAWNYINENYAQYNVKKFDQDPKSILNHYRNLIKIRREHKALALGSYQGLYSNNKDRLIHSYLRVHGDDKLLMIHNFSSKKISNITIDLKDTILMNKKGELGAILGEGKFKMGGNKLTVPKMEPYTSLILKAE